MESSSTPVGNVIRLGRLMPKVYNKRHKDVPKDAIYVGRPTKWGNPFTHLVNRGLAEVKVGTREEAVSSYKDYLLSHQNLINDVKLELRGKDLVCWCAPKPCHADVLLEIANANSQ
jgi:hypothetical protein